MRQGPAQPQNPGVVTQQGYTVPAEQYHPQMPSQPYPNPGYSQQMPPAVPYGNQGNYYKRRWIVLHLKSN